MVVQRAYGHGLAAAVGDVWGEIEFMDISGTEASATLAESKHFPRLPG